MIDGYELGQKDLKPKLEASSDSQQRQKRITVTNFNLEDGKVAIVRKEALRKRFKKPENGNFEVFIAQETLFEK